MRSSKQGGRDERLSVSGIARGVTSGLRGEEVSARGVIEAVGGVRGILETVLPALLYLATFVITEDVTLSVIAPIAVALVLLVWRLVKRETLVTGEGRGYFIPGFWINGAWAVALTLSMVIGWPLLGFVVGVLRNDLTGWRRERRILLTAFIATAIWLTLFLLRLAVQLPLYFAGDSAVAALGTARLVMGTPLFALVILVTWLLFRNIPRAERGAEQ